ncbi:TlpA family protein disulfide reductase [Hymenobacter sp. BT175]|uniref:TlpA family protein disulfide reductase n=1 Tax=Hymenobacter translucens TaxID=2886507 RepID=UPI001D0E1164|nr:TlpA disulfide reductase family protein [Hymenobacter translucens]MCC2545695.1 TlpA family protein disulfide reductase [Hymenobacter translucens]
MAFIFRFSAGLALLTALLSTPHLGRAQGTVVLTGKISNPTDDSIAVSVRENPLSPKELITYAGLNDKGEFRLALTVAGPTKADLVYGDDVAIMFLEPGNSLDLRFKGEEMQSTLKFKANDVSGRRANLTPDQLRRQQAANANNYLVEVDEKFIANDGFQVLPDNITFYEPGFLGFLDYRRKEEMNFLEDNSEKEALSPAFYNYAKAEIDYSYANDRLTFQDLREQVVVGQNRMKMSEGYYDFLKEESLINNPGAITSDLYHEFLLNYVHFSAVAAKHQRTDPDFYRVCYDIAKKQLTGPAQPIIMGRVLQESFRFAHVKQSAAMLEEFRAVDAKGLYLPLLQHDFDQHKTFAIGAPAPNFKLVSVTGDSVSLRDFQGKLVYLNFWKSTSGLCLRDLPYAQDLARKFEGKNIVFINIAFDENEPAWKQLVTSKKLPGVHLRVSGGLRSALAKSYALQEVPTYLLLGEDGTFLNTKPKRLSSRAAVDEIKESFGKASTYSSTLTPDGSK